MNSQGCVRIAAIIVSIPILLFILLFMPFVYELIFYTALGWAFFLARVVPQAKVDGAGIATGAACLTLIAVGSHGFARWLYERPGEDGAPAARRWQRRWTAIGVTVFVLMFVAGLASGGLAHQVVWLVGSGESLIQGMGGASVAARRAQSISNLRQIGIGLNNYQEAEKTFPPGAVFDRRGEALHGWQARMLPYLDHSDLYDAINFAVPWTDPRNAQSYRTEVQTFRNPAVPREASGTGYAPSHYAGNVLMLGGDVPRPLAAITDGTSNTILAGEALAEFKPWGDPTNWRDFSLGLNRSPRGFGNPGMPGGANVLFADGSVRFLSNTINPRVFRALATPDGGETVSSDDY